MAQEEEEYESHFVENPFIKIRERALKKKLDSKASLGAKQLMIGGAEQDDEQMMESEDIVMVKESGKFLINDLELLEKEKQKMKNFKGLGKRMRIQGN